jgi:hypothetical protein
MVTKADLERANRDLLEMNNALRARTLKAEQGEIARPATEEEQAATKAARHQQLVERHTLGLSVQASTFEAAVAQAVDFCHSWFTHVQGFDRDNFDGDCMLVTSELAEAVEGDRKKLADPDCPGFQNREVEIADALVRIFHLAGKYGLRLGPAYTAKMKANLARPYKHGKGY